MLFGPVIIIATFHLSPCHVYHRIQSIYDSVLVSIKENVRKNSLRAQMACLTSFEPFFVNVADTACISADMDATNFNVLFQQLLYKLHLTRTES